MGSTSHFHPKSRVFLYDPEQHRGAERCSSSLSLVTEATLLCAADTLCLPRLPGQAHFMQDVKGPLYFLQTRGGSEHPFPLLLEPDEAPIRPGAREIRKSSHSQFPTNLTLGSCCRKNKSPSTLEIPRNHSVLELQAPTRACSLTSPSSAPHPLCKWRN